MRPEFACVLAVCAAGAAAGAEPLDDLFAGWAKAQGRVESLVVEFALETKEPAFGTSDRFTGAVRLIRTRAGEVFASYERVAEGPKRQNADRWSALLNGGKVYLLNHDQKAAIRFEPARDELVPFLEKHFSPFVVLLDRKRAEAKHRLEVVKQDEWYTYLAVKPKQVKRTGWLPDNFHDGRVVLMRKDSDAIPKGMPRQLWYADGAREHLVTIKAWRLNRADAPKQEAFARPEDRPGWRVMKFPLQRE